jgi:hypothetical protein
LLINSSSRVRPMVAPGLTSGLLLLKSMKAGTPSYGMALLERQSPPITRLDSWEVQLELADSARSD